MTTDGVSDVDFGRGCAMAVCPECEAVLDIEDDVDEGQLMDCPECGAELEVVSTNPVEIRVISEADENEEESGNW
ncbi:MAG: hypothetical protein ACE145_04950 [Terriglobia bacterium]